jgi:hypothetical protein
MTPESLTMFQPNIENAATRVDIPRFGLQRSEFWTRVFVFGLIPAQGLIMLAALFYLQRVTAGPFYLLIPLIPFAVAVSFYLDGFRFPVRLEVCNGQLVWSGLFSERSVPMDSVVGATVYGITISGFTIHINGAPDMSIPMAYKEWNKFAQAVNHYYPSCNLPLNKTTGKRSIWMKFFHE